MNGALFAGRRRKAEARRGLRVRRPRFGRAPRRMHKVPSDRAAPRGFRRFPVKCGQVCGAISAGAAAPSAVSAPPCSAVSRPPPPTTGPPRARKITEIKAGSPGL